MDKLEEMKAWELIDVPPRKRSIANKWVYSLKEGAKKAELTDSADSTDYSITLDKARLVAHGDLQQYGIDYEETFAPVIKLVSLCIMLTIVVDADQDLKY